MDLHPKQFARLHLRTVKDETGREKIVDRHFSVDPRTITIDRLRHLLARVLDIRHDFDLLFQRSGGGGEAVPLSCDWDLEGALAEEPRIDLALQLKPQEPGFDEWDIISDVDVPVTGPEASTLNTQRKRRGTFLDQIFNKGWPTPGPLTEAEFLSLCDWPCPLRYAVYRAEGADPQIRPALWMHLLDVYPTNAGHREREEFLNRKAEEYYGLRHSWQKLVQAGTIPSILRDVTCLVRKDVRRTDRLKDLDEHALYNILTTYAVHHPSTGYCQGMSDLLSPLLFVMKTEARAYVAFCGLMLRMRNNFRRDGRSICIKFRHLRRALCAHDSQLYDYLSSIGALDLLFCYRWLLLDLKREFEYEEMLRFTEVLWSTFRPLNSEKGVDLYEVRFPTTSICRSIREKTDPHDLLVFTENYFGSPKRTTKAVSLKRWALLSRRQSIYNAAESDNGSSTEDEDGGIVHYRKRRRSRNICRSWSGRDSADDPHRKLCYSVTLPNVRFDPWMMDSTDSSSGGRRRHGSSDSNYESNFSEDELHSEEETRDKSEGYASDRDSHRTLMTDHSQSSESDDNHHFNDSILNSFDSADTYFNEHRPALQLLPPPTRLGDGKPFLIFSCLTMILHHRDVLLTRKMDANEIGIYFDRLVRRHKLDDVLPKAKEMFIEYLNSGWTEDD